VINAKQRVPALRGPAFRNFGHQWFGCDRTPLHRSPISRNIMPDGNPECWIRISQSRVPEGIAAIS
jgi:hypothetical protein